MGSWRINLIFLLATLAGIAVAQYVLRGARASICRYVGRVDAGPNYQTETAPSEFASVE